MLISVRNLEKIYDNEGVKTPALRGVSFDIEKGEFVSVMGPSGCGRSTLMQILGLLDRPTGGSYILDGADVATFDDDELARLRNKKLGFVFQSFNLLPRTTVAENVELPLLYDDDPIEANTDRVMTALRAVGIDHRAGYFSNQLSGLTPAPGRTYVATSFRPSLLSEKYLLASEPRGESASSPDVITGGFAADSTTFLKPVRNSSNALGLMPTSSDAAAMSFSIRRRSREVTAEATARCEEGGGT